MENNIIKIYLTDRTGKEQALEVPTDMGLNLMEVCKSYELPVEGTCGGMALCASCHLYVISPHNNRPVNTDEEAMLDDAYEVKPNSRLACQIPITKALDGLRVQLAPEYPVEENAFADW